MPSSKRYQDYVKVLVLLRAKGLEWQLVLKCVTCCWLWISVIACLLCLCNIYEDERAIFTQWMFNYYRKRGVNTEHIFQLTLAKPWPVGTLSIWALKQHRPLSISAPSRPRSTEDDDDDGYHTKSILILLKGLSFSFHYCPIWLLFHDWSVKPTFMCRIILLNLLYCLCISNTVLLLWSIFMLR